MRRCRECGRSELARRYEGGEMAKRKIIRTLTEREEAELHFKDLRNRANTFDGCIRDIRQYTPQWLDRKAVEDQFRKLVRERSHSHVV